MPHPSSEAHTTGPSGSRDVRPGFKRGPGPGRGFHQAPPRPTGHVPAATVAVPAPAPAAAAPPKQTRITTEDVHSKKGLAFSDFFLKKDLQMGIYEQGFETPTPVQEDSIPLLLSGHHVIARAKNGTGKTGAYVIPALEALDVTKAGVQVLILVPARELALQVSKFVLDIGKHLGVKCMASIGGSRVDQDVRTLQNDPPHVLVSTPARALDLAVSRSVDLSQVEFVALDEADKLLSVDFENDVRECLYACGPKPTGKREEIPQTALFSATFPVGVRKFVEEVLGGDVKVVNVMSELTLRGISQYCVVTEEATKLRCLNALFRKLAINQSIIFCNSVSRVELLARRIHDSGYPCYYIHSKMDQHDRNKVFALFKEGKARHLVASDVFARGIDVQAVNVVINFDFPKSSETYLHRIGRSGRYGHLGLAINFVTSADRQNMAKVEAELGTFINPIPKEIPLTQYTG